MATQLTGPGGLDGLVLSSSILVDDNSRPVPAMPLDTLQFPVLVIHHEQNACGPCPYDKVPLLMQKIAPSQKTQFLTFKGGISQGDACEASLTAVKYKPPLSVNRSNGLFEDLQS